MYKGPCNVYQKSVEDFKRQYLRAMLEAHNGNRTRAARALGLQRTYFLRLIRQLGIMVPVPGRWRR